MKQKYGVNIETDKKEVEKMLVSGKDPHNLSFILSLKNPESFN